ncbi:beta-CASP ribonuclease aCPSF1 [Candidatus Pacearchaeota archaeon]|nr:beta-CASP ribonuclease aCPSF1 [Candidatus Pacearchaeota archaeon]|tara:strand:+ start:21665 stop:23551 length:1887 start_codon:yes stop_codon:yes gene_type:complete
MADILKDIQKELPKVISSANFEGANIVLYTDEIDFLVNNDGKIRELVGKFKKRIELRADPKLLKTEEETDKIIREIVPEESELTSILFDPQRSIVVIEAKRPGLVIGKSGGLLKEIKEQTLWIPQIQRSPAIQSKITENIRNVLYQNNNARKRFLNSVGKKIYKEWNPEKMEGWIRVTMLGGGRQVGRSCILLQTQTTKVLMDCGINPAAKGKDRFPYLDISEFKISELDAIILSHAHLDHSGLIPYLFKMGYRGPIYMTAPTRDLAALLALDFIGVAYKQAAAPLFSSVDVKEMVKHTICLDYNEVTDIAPDIRITFYNAGHALGSAETHINIGNGAHNLVYSADIKYLRTRLLEKANSHFPRVETMILEATYGGKNNILPSRRESEEALIKEIKVAIDRGGKVLIPELGLGRAQETMLILDEAMKNNLMPKVPIYIDGMIWDINGIHTAYPDFLNSQVRRDIFQDKNPFVSDIFKRVGSPGERKEVIEGSPCIVLATSGMLVGGASVEYFRHFAINPENKLCFVCYQGAGSLGKQVQDGAKIVKMNIEGKEEIIHVNFDVTTIDGLSAHAGRNELLNFANQSQPRASKIILNHGEQSRCLDLASSIYKLHHIETNVPKNMETIRLK